MEQQTNERVGALETDVAVINSTYVRRDEFAALREEMNVGFAKTNAKLDLAQAELHSKMNVGFAEIHSKMNVGFTKITSKVDTGLARLDAKTERTTAMLMKWMFASQISVAALFIAAIKYL